MERKVVGLASATLAFACGAWAAGSDTPQSLLARYAEHARTADPAFYGYSAELAPLAYPKRFTEYARVEKYFKVNGTMVLRRECTAQEKGDLIAWLLTVEGEAIYPAGRVTGPARVQEE